jgi:plasmid stability protein
MATLYVENVPDDLYEALRKHAKSQRRSIAAEVVALLEQFYPTEKELKRRRAASAKLKELRFTISGSQSQLPSVVEMIREDRDR